MIRFLLALAAALCVAGAVADAQQGYGQSARHRTVSVGAVGFVGMSSVMSDVVGPDSPEGSHERRTNTFGGGGGLELGWTALKLPSMAFDLRTRIMGTWAGEGREVVHVHKDIIPGGLFPDTVTTNHGVVHATSRWDIQAVIAWKHDDVPVQVEAGVTASLQTSDRVDETYAYAEQPQNGTVTTYKSKGRVGLVLGAGLPIHVTSAIDVVPSLVADIGLVNRIEGDIPYKSSFYRLECVLRYRF
ncbi:MAG: hypothetical protein J0I17_04400 ['Candidatus Kapabacteria' thiocyanatum]|uniref:Outer membrane protein beta-barrel domain-containing protein n=1 Tax=Candidatus Kapaibacterium thiocyanatum TaxID=1895771 RepID=A0A1M3L5S6_9BACT|nr:hypothetical protein ['Candidatus Kapabacteria' thiocyanatum]OJX60900.1 MAG: hypothetical protein BGO89_04875 ['Candidatus Kapabacteria' thiocyanatum]